MTSLGDAYRSLPRTPAVSAVRDRHLDFYRSFARRADDAFHGRERDIWLELLEAEIDNMRAALAWAIESGQADAAQDLAASCERLWYSDRYTEGRQWLGRSLAIGDRPSPERVRALLASWSLARIHAPHGREFVEEAVHLAEQIDDPVLRVDATRRLAWLYHHEARPEEAAATFERAVELGRSVPGAERHLADALRGLAPFHAEREIDEREPEKFLAALRPRLEEARRLVDVPGLEGAACVHLAMNAGLLVHLGDLTGAVELFKRKLALEQDPGLASGKPHTLLRLGELQLLLGQHGEARALCQQVLGLRSDNHVNILRAEVRLADLDLREADLESARARIDRALAIAGAAQDAVDQFPWDLPEALQMSADLAEHAGDPTEAERVLHQLMAVSRHTRRTDAVIRLGGLVGRCGDVPRAIRLLRAELEGQEMRDRESYYAKNLRSRIAEMEDDLDTAWDLALASREVGFDPLIPTAAPTFASRLARLALRRGDPETARQRVEEALPPSGVPSPQTPIALVWTLSRIALMEGDADAAWSTLQRLLPRWPEVGGADNWVDLVETVARAAIATGRVERGAELLGLADAERERIVYPRPDYAQTEIDAAGVAARVAVGDELFTRAKARGRVMDLRTEMWKERDGD